jgi:hypothetical protein
MTITIPFICELKLFSLINRTLIKETARITSPELLHNRIKLLPLKSGNYDTIGIALISIEDDLFLGWITEDYKEEVREGLEGSIKQVETFK